MITEKAFDAAQHKFNIICDLICTEEISEKVRGFSSRESLFNLRADIRRRLAVHMPASKNDCNIVLNRCNNGEKYQIGWRVTIHVRGMTSFDDIFYFPHTQNARVASHEPPPRDDTPKSHARGAA